MADPLKLTPEVHRQLVDAAAADVSISDAARAAGVTRDTLRDWIRRGRVETVRALATSSPPTGTPPRPPPPTPSLPSPIAPSCWSSSPPRPGAGASRPSGSSPTCSTRTTSPSPSPSESTRWPPSTRSPPAARQR